MKEGALVILQKPYKQNCHGCKMKTQKRKQPRHIASVEKVRMLYFSPSSPYIPSEPFIL
jgi:hypothetical protein